MEVQARCPLIWKLGLEYQGTAIPNLTPLGHDRIQQDVRLAVPLGDAGKFRLGAKHQLELTLPGLPCQHHHCSALQLQFADWRQEFLGGSA